MAPHLRLLALGATLLAAAIAGVALLSGGGQGPRPAASPTSQATLPSSPGGSASPFACFGETTGCAGDLDAGTHASRSFSRPFEFQAQAGWTNVRDIPRTYGLEFSGVSDGPVPAIEVMSMIAIADQTARCDPVVKPGVGASVDDLVAYVRAHPGLVAAAPVAVKLDGYSGQRIDFVVAPTWATVCDGFNTGVATVMMLTDTGPPPNRAIGYDADQRVRWTVLDVAGDTVIVEYVGPALVPDFEAMFGRAQVLMDTVHFVPAS